MQLRTSPSEDHRHVAPALNASAGDRVARAALCFQLPTDGQVPEWIQLIPAPGTDGAIRGRDGRVFRMASATDVASRFQIRMPVDVNHATEILAPKGFDAPAVGWIEQLEARNGALWGRIEWTDRGAAAVKGKDYRFVSPAFTHASSGEIHQLTSVGLTNTPNFDLALNAAHNEDLTMLTAILAALGLSSTASSDDAVVAINALKASMQTALNAAATPPLDKFVPRQDYDAALNRATTAETTLKAQADATRDAAITAEVDAASAAGKITPATREFYVAMCRTEGGLEQFRKFVAAATPVLNPAESGAGADAGKGKGGALTDHQKALCQRLGISETDYQAALGTAA